MLQGTSGGPGGDGDVNGQGGQVVVETSSPIEPPAPETLLTTPDWDSPDFRVSENGTVPLIASDPTPLMPEEEIIRSPVALPSPRLDWDGSNREKTEIERPADDSFAGPQMPLSHLSGRARAKHRPEKNLPAASKPLSSNPPYAAAAKDRAENPPAARRERELSGRARKWNQSHAPVSARRLGPRHRGPGVSPREDRCRRFGRRSLAPSIERRRDARRLGPFHGAASLALPARHPRRRSHSLRSPIADSVYNPRPRCETREKAGTFLALRIVGCVSRIPFLWVRKPTAFCSDYADNSDSKGPFLVRISIDGGMMARLTIAVLLLWGTIVGGSLVSAQSEQGDSPIFAAQKLGQSATKEKETEAKEPAADKDLPKLPETEVIGQQPGAVNPTPAEGAGEGNGEGRSVLGRHRSSPVPGRPAIRPRHRRPAR